MSLSSPLLLLLGVFALALALVLFLTLRREAQKLDQWQMHIEMHEKRLRENAPASGLPPGIPTARSAARETRSASCSDYARLVEHARSRSQKFND